MKEPANGSKWKRRRETRHVINSNPNSVEFIWLEKNQLWLVTLMDWKLWASKATLVTEQKQ